MKDYSQYMTNKSAFIKKYEIKDDKIYVYFANTDERKPNIYDLNEETINMLDQRLEEQYEILIENHEVMMKSKFAKTLMYLSIPFAIFGVLGFANIGLDLTLCIHSCLLSGGLLMTGLISKVIKESKNYEEIATYDRYLDNKENLSDTIEKDPNITRYISKEAQTNLSNQEQLVDRNLIDNPFNANFMDNASIEDLKEIMHRLKIYQGLSEGQAFADSKEETKTKEKVKKRTK